MLRVDSVSEFTIDWSRSDSADIVRYIVDVREYSSDGPGKVQMTSVTGYPLEIPGTDLEHTVKALSKILFIYTHLLMFVMILEYILTEPEVPYDIQLVAGNTIGCGDLHISKPLFTQEGGIIIYLFVVLISYSTTCHTLAPESPPHNVSGNRLSNNTLMNVSFIGLSIVEAHSVNITYTVRYSSVEFQKRQSHVKEVVVPDNQHHMIIGGLDQSTTYHVVVDASNNNGTVSSSPFTVHPGIYS